MALFLAKEKSHTAGGSVRPGGPFTPFSGPFKNGFCPDGASCEMVNGSFWECSLPSSALCHVHTCHLLLKAITEPSRSFQLRSSSKTQSSRDFAPLTASLEEVSDPLSELANT